MFVPTRVRSALGRLWAPVRTLMDMLFLIRFSVVLGLVGIVLFLGVPQGREILRHLSEEGRGGHAVWFLIATLLCSGSTWYCARLLFAWEGSRPLCEAWPSGCEWLPRALGASIPVAFATRLSGLLWMQILLVVVAVLFLVFVWKRRDLFGLGPLKVWTAKGELSPGAKWYVGVSIGLYGLLLLLFSLSVGQHVVAPAMGAGAVVLIGLGLLIPLGAILVYAGQVTRFPFLGAILTWAILISWFSDNHDVRTLEGETGITGYEDLAGYYRAWRDDLLASATGDTVPVYVVSAEGGGIRAAYWTAHVLSALQDRSKGRFSRHVFAISGVSGGSVGASLFASQVASPDTTTHVARAKAMLERDALSPILASFVFPDMFQRLIPYPVFHDRAEALETTWEKAWRDAGNEDDRFAAPMDSLWQGDPFSVPLLFLNSTVVESGDRIIVHPLEMTIEGFQRTFRQADDARHVIDEPLRLSTAAHMSARFTYVSPAGSIDRRDEPGKSIRVVDGGYFENSGAVTAEEILDTMLAEEGADSRIQFILLHISNDPHPVRGETREEKRQERRIFLNEALSPMRALLNARSARGFQAREHLWQEFERATGREVVHFDLFEDRVELPLGWLLSTETFEEMERRLEMHESQAKITRALELL